MYRHQSRRYRFLQGMEGAADRWVGNFICGRWNERDIVSGPAMRIGVGDGVPFL